jgi:hypothetical protein
MGGTAALTKTVRIGTKSMAVLAAVWDVLVRI